MNDRQAGRSRRPLPACRAELVVGGMLSLSVLLGCPHPKVPEIPAACIAQQRVQTPLAHLALQVVSQYGRLDPKLFTVEQSARPRVGFVTGATPRPGDNPFPSAIVTVNEGERMIVDTFIQKLQAANSSCGDGCSDTAYNLEVRSETPPKMVSPIYHIVLTEGQRPSPAEVDRFVTLFSHTVDGCPFMSQIEAEHASATGATGGSTGGDIGTLAQPQSSGTVIATVYAGTDCDRNVTHCVGCSLPDGDDHGTHPDLGAYHPDRKGIRYCCGATCPCDVHPN